MDTTWFAVDADGYVALFHSGDTGYVPNGAARMDNGFPYGIFDTIEDFRTPIRSSAIAGVHIAERAAVEVPTPELWSTLNTPISGLFVLSDDEALAVILGSDVDAWEIQSDSYLVRYAGSLPVYFLEDCNIEQVRLAWEQGKLKALRLTEKCAHFFELEVLQPYQFEADFGSNNYLRRNLPERPMRLLEVSPELADQLGQLKMPDLHFKMTNVVYPCMQALCSKDGLSVAINPIADGAD